MLEFLSSIDAFPSNGLDRSLHAPVLIGVLLLTFFKETFGWTYAGLVVPGYLATVLLAAPLTGGLVVLESIATLILASALGRWIPTSGLWSVFFGRERFLLLIVSALVVRLGVEGALLPGAVEQLGVAHSRVLYSLGLVLVPLLANSYWNAGFVRTFPRVGFITLLTYLIVSEILLKHTNFSISRFEIANESVSLAFLESPHAHIILLIGALLGARYNLHYGWDYNGILVPALLAVAWYEPLKVATTLLEAILVYVSCIGLMKVRPFSRALIVGSRRTLMAFSVGFLFKYAAGFVLQHYAPTVQLIDYFGFGYLLPTLLAVKIWNRGNALVVLGPVLQVSLIAFPLGSLVGYLIRDLGPGPSSDAQALPAASPQGQNVTMALMLGDSAPAPHRTGTLFKGANTYAVTLAALSDFDPERLEQVDVRRLRRFGMGMTSQLPGGWVVMVPWSESPDQDVVGPRIALQNSSLQGRKWFVVADAEQVASAAIAGAVQVAEHLDAASVQVWSHLDSVKALDKEFTENLALQNSGSHLVIVRIAETQTSTAELAVAGQLPEGLTPIALGQALGLPVQVRWLSAQSSESALTRVSLTLPPAAAHESVAGWLSASPSEDWGTLNQPQLDERLSALTRTGTATFVAPTTAELRVLSEGVLAPWLARTVGAPRAWEAALAAQLGYKFARVAGVLDGWAMFEPESPERRGRATLLRRLTSQSTPGLCVGVPAPRWETGTLGTGVRLLDALNAQTLVVHGALPNAAADGSADVRGLRGRRSYYQRMIEAWLNSGGSCMTIRGVTGGAGAASSSVLTLERELLDLRAAPGWLTPLLQQMEALGVPLVPFDGSAASVEFEGAGDPLMSYSRSFARGKLAMLWLTAEARSVLQLGTMTAGSLARLRRWSEFPRESPEVWLEALRACSPEHSSPHGSDCARLKDKSCRPAAAIELWSQYAKSLNPHLLPLAFAETRRCAWNAVVDPNTETAWIGVAGPRDQHVVATLLPLTDQGAPLDQAQQVTESGVRRLLAMPLRVLEVQVR
jgi:hypothetical protein